MVKVKGRRGYCYQPFNLSTFPSLFRNNPSLNLLDLGMVGHRIDMAITGAEEAAQDPTDQPDNDPGKESRPEAGYMEPRNHLGDKEDEQGIDHQDEETHGDNDERETQQEEHRPHQGIDDPQKKGGSQQCTVRIAT